MSQISKWRPASCTNTCVLCDDVLDTTSETEIVQLAGRHFEISDMKVAERPHA